MRGVPVWGLMYFPDFCIFVTAVYCHLVTAALSVIKQVLYMCR